MTAKIFVFQHILIYQELYFMIFVIYKPHDTDSSWFNIKIFQHILRFCKGKPC